MPRRTFSSVLGLASPRRARSGVELAWSRADTLSVVRSFSVHLSAATGSSIAVDSSTAVDSSKTGDSRALSLPLAFFTFFFSFSFDLGSSAFAFGAAFLAESVFVFELLAGSLFVAKAEAFAAALSGGLGAIQSGSAAEKPEGLTAPQEAKVSKIVSRVDETSFGLGAHDGAVEKGNFSGQARRARARTRKELDGVSCFT